MGDFSFSYVCGVGGTVPTVMTFAVGFVNEGIGMGMGKGNMFSQKWQGQG